MEHSIFLIPKNIKDLSSNPLKEYESTPPTISSLEAIKTLDVSVYVKISASMETHDRSAMLVDLNQGFGSPINLKFSQPKVSLS